MHITSLISEIFTIQNKESPSQNISMKELFQKFCSTSSIHGTYFWFESRTWYSKVIWALIVLVGMTLAALFIYKHNLSWQAHPVVTSVKQIPIGEVTFPAITICPRDNTRYRYKIFKVSINYETRNS